MPPTNPSALHPNPSAAALPYNSALSLWLSVDPLSDKYPGSSPYVYCANNLVRLVDVDGRTFEVADNEESHRDIISIVSEHHRDRICFGENGLVTVNTEGLSEAALKNDIGLSLINDMANSDKAYYYETADMTFCRNSNGERSVHTTYASKNKGVLNASLYGLDGQDSHRELPMEGFDGQVCITAGGRFKLYGRDCRKEIVFHELAENYLRTDKNMNYNSGAHDFAADWAFSVWGGQQGVANEYIEPTAPRKLTGQRVINYMNQGVYK